MFDKDLKNPMYNYNGDWNTENLKTWFICLFVKDVKIYTNYQLLAVVLFKRFGKGSWSLKPSSPYPGLEELYKVSIYPFKNRTCSVFRSPLSYEIKSTKKYCLADTPAR